MKLPEPRKLPSGSWFIQLRLNGVSVPVTASSRTECINAARLIKAEHKAGKRRIRQKSESPTLRSAIDAYIDARRNVLSPSTIRGYATIRDNRFPDVMDKRLPEISWQDAVNAEAAAHAPKTVKNEWRFISSVLRENGILPPKVTLPQLVQKEHDYLDADQIPAFVSAVKDNPCCIQALLALHGLRRSELVALDWSNVDLKNGLLHIRGAAVYNEDQQLVRKETNKNTSSRRTVPIMIPELEAALRAVPEDQRTGPVVTVTPNAILKQINRVCRSAGLPEVGTHGLRHSFASLAFSSDVGMTEREVMELGGWSDPQTVHKIYEHLARRNRLKAENKMAQFYKNANKNANDSKK